MQRGHKWERLRRGCVIPALPLALDAERRWDQRRQRALLRYYLEAGAGGLAVAVHTTQFEIRLPQHGLLQPLLELAMEEQRRHLAAGGAEVFMVAGVIGQTPQALAEAELAASLGYDAALLSLAALKDASNQELLEHARAVAAVLPVVGFYLQPAVGGRELDAAFWREFAAIERVVAIKMAPFDRYRTIDVLHGVVQSGRAAEIALYTGNDDNIVADLLTTYRLHDGARWQELRIVGGLLGHWAVWTRRAVELLDEIHSARSADFPALLAKGVAITDCNAAFFDAAQRFAGCIAGIHEVLRRQGLLAGTWTLNPAEALSPGQLEEIERVYRAYPELHDDDFVSANLERWLSE